MDKLIEKLIELDKKYVWHPFTQMAGWLKSEPIVIDSAEGFYLIDTEGKRYIDGASSLWCNVHGHRVRQIDDAIKAQVDKVSHSTLLGLGQTRSIELAERLVQIAPSGLEKVFYSDSGATAVEIGLKMAYQYFQNLGEKRRTEFIALQSSYHGDTIGSVSLGGIKVFHSIFRSLLFETHFVPAPHPYRFDGSEKECALYSLSRIEDVLSECSEQIVAVVIEPLVQGAGGIIVHPHGFLSGVRQLTQKYGVLLIADEVATGFGRTGKMFACEVEQVSPDIMCLGKGITAGYLPLAATLTTQEIFDAFLGGVAEHKTFYHGHTYTGNALGCAAALASLNLFEQNQVLESLPGKIELVRQYFSKISELPFVGDARQCGLMGGIEIVKDKASKESFPFEWRLGVRLCSSMRAEGVMLRPLGDCVVVMPPIAIDLGLLEKLLGIMYRAVKNELPGIIESCDAD
ncbi:MAG: adenosylmethionine--8-amino-7-oxononanoate transaminase [Planctomycetota bacterium]|jgi:adenosylmethionine-8-amino-7-oxononanoate aminotransferase